MGRLNLLISNQFFLIAMILLLLVMGTGLYSDDFASIVTMSGQDFLGFVNSPGRTTIFGLPTYYLFWWAYPVFGAEIQWPYDLIKFTAHLLALVLIYHFGRTYLAKERAFIFALFFVLYPLHDTTTYWYMTAPYILLPAVVMYSHALIDKENYVQGLLVGFIGAFMWYSSPPYTFGLSVIFLFQREFKKFFLFLVPGIVYVIYYFSIRSLYPELEDRVNIGLNIATYLKQMVMQVASFTEASLGPSYFYKIYESLFAIDGFALIIVGGLLFVIARMFSQGRDAELSESGTVETSNRKVSTKLLALGFCAVLLLSFAMFALTGAYPHSAFNLGNRSTVYGALILALGLALLPYRKWSLALICIVFIVPVAGLSAHWKAWNSEQHRVISNLQSNPKLKAIAPDETLIITGHLYSKLGRFSHVEFLSQPWVVKILLDGFVQTKHVIVLAPYVELKGDTLVDTKFGGIVPLDRGIFVYDSETNTVSSVQRGDIEGILASQPQEVRHWVQLYSGTWIERFVVSISPRLAYLFN